MFWVGTSFSKKRRYVKFYSLGMTQIATLRCSWSWKVPLGSNLSLKIILLSIPKMWDDHSSLVLVYPTFATNKVCDSSQGKTSWQLCYLESLLCCFLKILQLWGNLKKDNLNLKEVGIVKLPLFQKFQRKEINRNLVNHVHMSWL